MSLSHLRHCLECVLSNKLLSNSALLTYSKIFKWMRQYSRYHGCGEWRDLVLSWCSCNCKSNDHISGNCVPQPSSEQACAVLGPHCIEVLGETSSLEFHWLVANCHVFHWVGNHTTKSSPDQVLAKEGFWSDGSMGDHKHSRGVSKQSCQHWGNEASVEVTNATWIKLFKLRKKLKLSRLLLNEWCA